MPTDYLKIARDIVLKHIDKTQYDVFLFGSRACGNFHSRSDIDIGILGKQPLNMMVRLNIEEALEQSIVPFKVDVVDFANASDTFKTEAFKEIVYWNKMESA